MRVEFHAGVAHIRVATGQALELRTRELLLLRAMKELPAREGVVHRRGGLLLSRYIERQLELARASDVRLAELFNGHAQGHHALSDCELPQGVHDHGAFDV